MDLNESGMNAQDVVKEVLGYLNFSSGASDPLFLANMDRLFVLYADSAEKDVPPWQSLFAALKTELKRLCGSSKAFVQVEQAEAVLHLVFDHVLTAYKKFHRDLLFHQTEDSLFQPFFIGRVCEAVLQEGGPWEETDRIVSGAIRRLNDFIGHRPIAVLESEQKLQPYTHEWVRPIPLYVRGAGVVSGRYHDLIKKTIDILNATDRRLLDRAWFDPDMLDELALDPRAYDFDHPVNRRPNYHFGQWDPNHIDNSGNYRRFVLQQVTLDTMLSRVEQTGELSYDQLLFEAAAVLAGTMLMGSGVSGSGPGVHDSDTSLATLMPQIAAYRDEFYTGLLDALSGKHAKRLQTEAKKLKQPFAGARQHLNQLLARRRANQLQHVHLALLYARMGYNDAALRQAQVVPVASARMKCEIFCRLRTAHTDGAKGRLKEAVVLVAEIEDILHRAIECGALADPRNILGFGGQYSLFPAVENSCNDHYVDELIQVMVEIFALIAQLEEEAAASGNVELQKALSDRMRKLAEWWDKFASIGVPSVAGFSGHLAWEAADHVATVLRAWQEAGTAAGDIAFWREHIGQFNSPKAYVLVIEALLSQNDPVAAMALLIQWLGQAEQIDLVEGDYSFHDLAIAWMDQLWLEEDAIEKTSGDTQSDKRKLTTEERWALVRKFLDFIEANADELWEVPQLELFGEAIDEIQDDELLDDEEEDENGIFSAAYENVTFQDTASDGFEGEMIEGTNPVSDFELAIEAERIGYQLHFLRTVAVLWKLAAARATTIESTDGDRDETLIAWFQQATKNCAEMLKLLSTVNAYKIQLPGTSQELLIEYDRSQGIKSVLLEQIIETCVETTDAIQLISAACRRELPSANLADWEVPARNVLRALFAGDVELVRNSWPDLINTLATHPLLYIPTSKGGNPRQIVASRNIQRVLQRLLACLPRLGLLQETFELLRTIQEMEWKHRVGMGAITQFDEMFEIGFKAIVRCMVKSSESWFPGLPQQNGSSQQKLLSGPADVELIDCLRQATDVLHDLWLEHSRGVRISVLETVADEKRWKSLKQFIENYGHDLFTQQFMNYGNLRAILHQGIDGYIHWLGKKSDSDEQYKMMADLDGRLDRNDAIEWMNVAIEAVVENYAEYIDYNSTTTQSDHGEMLYTLLDFLRLNARYNHVCWNLQPLFLAHEILIRSGRTEVAELWRAMVADKTVQMADTLIDRCRKLGKKYGMWLPSVADRLGERFVRPLIIDQLCALVEPAIDELESKQETNIFALLQEEIKPLADEPSGVGFDIPTWLESLEREVDELNSDSGDDRLLTQYAHIQQVQLSLTDMRHQIAGWEQSP